MRSSARGRRSFRYPACSTPTPADPPATPRSEPARTVAGIGALVPVRGVIEWYDAAMRRPDDEHPPAERTGPPGARRDNELFTVGEGRMTVFRPVRPRRRARRRGRRRQWQEAVPLSL